MALVGGKSFIFIHIYKCGGMSLRTLIQDNIPCFELNQSHCTALEIKQQLNSFGIGHIWDSSYKFSFVRNPFDWVVSLYEFIWNEPTHENYEDVRHLNFEQFCQWNIDSIINGKNNSNGKFHKLTDFLYDVEGNLLVDAVGKIETFDKDVKNIFNNINIPFYKIPKINQSNRTPDYRAYYNDNSRYLIETFFAEDLKNFNYKF